jgi:hypothetical protein
MQIFFALNALLRHELFVLLLVLHLSYTSWERF